MILVLAEDEMALKLRLCGILLLAFTILPLRPAGADGPVRSLPWLHEGLMLTYTWYAAVAPGNGSDYQEDANGEWMDKNGKRYSRSTQQGTSGSGWNEITVACIDGDRVVLSSSSFANAGALGNNQAVPQQTGRSFVAPVNDPGDYWMDPAKLAAMRTDTSRRILVTRGPWKIGDHTTDAVRVQVVKSDSYSDNVYDAKSGLCIHWAGSAVGAPPEHVGMGDFGQGNSLLTHGDLVATRDLAIPWAKDTTPDWVSGLRSIHYQGSSVSRGSLPTLPNTIIVDMVPTMHGQGWIGMTSTFHSQTQGTPATPASKTQLATGRAQFGGMWIGVASGARLQRGQVLDDDPITKMKTSVTKADDQSVVISSINAAGKIDSQYDRHTGMLIGIGFYDVLSKQQISVRMQSHQ